MVILTIAEIRHRPYPMMMAWTAIILTVCLAPIGVWLFDEHLVKLGKRRGRKAPAPQRQRSPREGSRPKSPLNKDLLSGTAFEGAGIR